MKNLLISVLLVCVVVGVQAQAPSQQWRSYTIVNTGTSYADSDIDTVAGITANLGGYNNVIFEARAKDSVSITKVYIDRSPVGRAAASYSVYDSLSTLTDTHNTGSVVVGTLRGPAVDKLGGVGWQFRIRIAFNSANNGVTSPTYGAVLKFHP
jgi:hypothetical protein